MVKLIVCQQHETNEGTHYTNSVDRANRTDIRGQYPLSHYGEMHANVKTLKFQS